MLKNFNPRSHIGDQTRCAHQLNTGSLEHAMIKIEALQRDLETALYENTCL
jgi:hypothetical protein